MRLLIIGASGVLGSRLYNDAVGRKWGVMGTYCSHESVGLFHLDLRDKKSVEKAFSLFHPEAVVLAGGITDVDLCEENPALAEEVNIKGTLAFAKKANEQGAKLVFLSTDYIFDGENGPYKEEDTPRPINVYGRTKLEAENIIRSLSKDSLIVRTAQLYGIDSRGKNFAVKIIRNMKNGRKVYAADDFYCTPTHSGSLSSCIIGLLESKRSGVYNAAGADFINRYEYVDKIADIFSLNKDLIVKVKLKDLGLSAKRPKKAGLKIDRIKKDIAPSLYDCEKGLGILKKEFKP